MGAVHGPQVVVAAVAGEGGQHLDAHALEVVVHDDLVALDVVLAHVVDDVVAGDLGLEDADLLVDPGDVDLVVAAGLAGAAEAGGVAHEDVDVGHLFHDFLGHGVYVVADERRGACLVDGHVLDVRHGREGFDDVLLEHLLGPEHDVLFLHVRGEGVLDLEIVVVADVALGLPGVVGAADRAVAYVDDVLHGRADDVLGPAVGAAALGDRARDGVEVAQGQGVGQGFARALDDGVLLAFRDALAALEQMVRHMVLVTSGVG